MFGPAIERRKRHRVRDSDKKAPHIVWNLVHFPKEFLEKYTVKDYEPPKQKEVKPRDATKPRSIQSELHDNHWKYKIYQSKIGQR